MLLTQWLSRFSLSPTRRHRRRPQVQDVFRQSDRVDVLEDRLMLSADTWFQLGADIDGEAAGDLEMGTPFSVFSLGTIIPAFGGMRQDGWP